ncbi:hypothetical protein CALVIDRAFT_104150 [Calocera viscosa TUFC12733]|uniref:Uncharacterized protein n=1 Tax=Calocera viscosa (strain TUFC12733) TaxID=1330018 RepID=A0A167MNY6_CALVF|nr:hypothetical protein CALVIDRAFT_104150 [Calocera viscosa TUFC12733]
MASLPTGTPNASTASLTLYPASSPQDESFGFGPEDSYDLVSPSDLDSPDSDPQKEHTPPPALPAWLVVPAMLTPSLSLGALLLPHTLESIPIVLGAIMLLLAIVISAGVQSIWRGAARYVRRETVEERVAEAFVGSGRGVRREKWKKLVSGITKAGMLSTGVGLCVVYLRSAVQLLVPHFSPHINPPHHARPALLPGGPTADPRSLRLPSARPPAPASNPPLDLSLLLPTGRVNPRLPPPLPQQHPAALASLPEEWGLSAVVWDYTLSSLLYFGYVLPALVHLILHHLRAPLAILFPSSAPMDSAHDALLLKKERSLQHKRETKRLLQDLLLFGVLLPGGLTVWGWSLGRFVRLW